MAKDKNHDTLLDAKEVVYENLEAIRFSLLRCIDEGMADLEDTLYNELLALIDDSSLVKTWDEMEELIAQAKVLEQDIASWLSRHGRTSYSLPWPKNP